MTNNNEVLVSLYARGFRFGMGTKWTGNRKSDNVNFFTFEDGVRIKRETENIFAAMSRKAKLRTPFPGIFAICEKDIPEMLAVLDKMEADFAIAVQYVKDNFDAIKAANRKEVEDSIKKEGKREQARILKAFDERLTERNFRPSIFAAIMSSGTGKLPDIEALSERIEDTAQELYKKAVFAEIAPVYEALASYYTKLSNGQDIGTKSENHFRDKLILELRENNSVRRDGFTNDLLAAINFNIENIFSDAMVCYDLVLNIYDEARKLGVDEDLPNLSAMEERTLKTLSKPRYLLDEETIYEDCSNKTPLKDMMGLISVLEVANV